MSSLIEKVSDTTTYDIQIVNETIAQSAKNVMLEMMKAVIIGLQEQISFKKLAEKHINPKLDEDLSGADENTKMVYQKLFQTSENLINIISGDYLAKTLLTIQMDTQNIDTSRQFLGSFVLPETETTIKELLDRAPASLDDKQFWV